MKKLITYINEKLRITKGQPTYKYFPKTKEQLKGIIMEKFLDDEKNYDLDLTDICTSDITDMSGLFNGFLIKDHIKLNPDVSNWDVENVEDMTGLFYNMESFNCNISNWNPKKCKSMKQMFWSCSNFNQDISGWDVSNVKDINSMFMYASKFNQNLDKWKIKIKAAAKLRGAFFECGLGKNYPKWYNI